ncbi:MAG: isoprenylcysteine carboxylmethyltransferase family protein [Chloroflexota bacterium]
MTSRIPSLGPGGIGWVALQGVCFALIAAAVAASPADTTDDPAATGTRHILGYMIGMIGAVFIGSGIAELRRAHSLSALPQPLPDAQLVERGPYRFVRHPIYGGLILGAIGLGVITPWIGTYISVALLAVVLDLKRRREEAWLGERFPGYAAYRSRTKALIPFLY